MSFYHITYMDVNAEQRRYITDKKREHRLRRSRTLHISDTSLSVRMRNSDNRFVGFVDLPINEWARTLTL